MPVDPASLDSYALEAVIGHPDLLGNVEWLRKACDAPDPKADDELLRVLLALIEDALEGALPLLGANDWSNIAGCLQDVKDCYPEGHEGFLTRFAHHEVVVDSTRGAVCYSPNVPSPALPVDTAPPTPGSRRRVL